MGSSPRKNFVIFIQTGAILCNTNWYICLDIMPQQESFLPILKHIYIWMDMYSA